MCVVGVTLGNCISWDNHLLSNSWTIRVIVQSVTLQSLYSHSTQHIFSFAHSWNGCVSMLVGPPFWSWLIDLFDIGMKVFVQIFMLPRGWILLTLVVLWLFLLPPASQTFFLLSEICKLLRATLDTIWIQCSLANISIPAHWTILASWCWHLAWL